MQSIMIFLREHQCGIFWMSGVCWGLAIGQYFRAKEMKKLIIALIEIRGHDERISRG
jgi:hypothetical protein